MATRMLQLSTPVRPENRSERANRAFPTCLTSGVHPNNAGYDAQTHHAYVTNGGKDAKLDYVMITEIATDTGEKLGELKVPGDTLEAMALEAGSRRMYINNSATNSIEVIDHDQHKIVANWPVTVGHLNVAMGVDESNHRLFVGCRDGHLVVMDSQTGKELQALPITTGKTDDLAFDPASKRIYVATAGSVDVYSQIDADHYKHLQTVKTSTGAKDRASGPGDPPLLCRGPAGRC